MSAEATWAWLVETIGLPAALALSAARGGRRIYVPARPGEHSPLVAIVGQEAAAALARAAERDTILVPQGPGLRAEVRRLRAEGLSVAQIARATRRSIRFVYEVLAEEGTPPDPDDPPPLLARML